MAISLFDASVPVFLRGLHQLAHVLDKGLAHAKATGIDPDSLVEARLAPDMFTLTGQIRTASDASKLGTARIAGLTAPVFADDETTYAQLQERTAKTIAWIKTVERGAIDGHEDRIVTIKARGEELQLAAQAYLLQFALPNFFFHVTTAYDVLRHSGVPLGKPDYLGPFWKPVG
ncbi:DUF1993 domain-containing protein [Variovorax dokdonensis]|uniref:DUF1993 domain-containing protein n=1 Tax=Variovorax dokdonensis TaxID=344883 RepID=A0ABT7N8C8_9BURK|nr:DUF1993 domain-containing protein [Variovorax dokdonensis]MDM0044181.1 DUF1993 domain-containing protein [Variovorax dokdonensis]